MRKNNKNCEPRGHIWTNKSDTFFAELLNILYHSCKTNNEFNLLENCNCIRKSSINLFNISIYFFFTNCFEISYVWIAQLVAHLPTNHNIPGLISGSANSAYENPNCVVTGLSTNILCGGDRLPMQGFFSKDSAGNILPTSRFVDELYTFCTFVNYIFFNVSLDDT